MDVDGEDDPSLSGYASYQPSLLGIHSIIWYNTIVEKYVSEFPVEILYYIINLLPMRDIHNLIFVCKSFNVRFEPIWRNIAITQYGIQRPRELNESSWRYMRILDLSFSYNKLSRFRCVSTCDVGPEIIEAFAYNFSLGQNRLEVLDLSSCRFSLSYNRGTLDQTANVETFWPGSYWLKIMLSNLLNLRKLCLNNCRLTDTDYTEICQVIPLLTRLTHIELGEEDPIYVRTADSGPRGTYYHKYGISDDVSKMVASSLCQLTGLEGLVIRLDLTREEGSELKQLTTLTNLYYLHINGITNGNSENIFEMIGSLTNLRRLRLCSNRPSYTNEGKIMDISASINPTAVRNFNTAMSKLCRLESLEISIALNICAGSITFPTHITELKLWIHDATTKSIDTIASNICKLARLTDLYLTGIERYNMGSLLRGLAQTCPCLQTLVLNTACQSESAYVSFQGAENTVMPSLSSLYINGDHNGNFMVSFMDFISNNTQLRNLSVLGYTHINRNTITEFKRVLNRLTYLERLYLTQPYRIIASMAGTDQDSDYWSDIQSYIPTNTYLNIELSAILS